MLKNNAGGQTIVACALAPFFSLGVLFCYFIVFTDIDRDYEIFAPLRPICFGLMAIATVGGCLKVALMWGDVLNKSTKGKQTKLVRKIGIIHNVLTVLTGVINIGAIGVGNAPAAGAWDILVTTYFAIAYYFGGKKLR